MKTIYLIDTKKTIYLIDTYNTLFLIDTKKTIYLEVAIYLLGMLYGLYSYVTRKKNTFFIDTKTIYLIDMNSTIYFIDKRKTIYCHEEIQLTLSFNQTSYRML